jgi:hypothetical protein
MSGCKQEPDFKSFDDIDVPKQYMNYRQETIENQKNAALNLNRSELNLNKTADSQQIRKKATDSKTFQPSFHSSSSIPGNQNIQKKLFTFRPASQAVQEGYQKAIKMISQGNVDSGLERLKHVASIAYEEPEPCAQIYFSIYDVLEKQGNMKEASFYFEKFQENLTKIHTAGEVAETLKSVQKADKTLNKLFPQPKEKSD